MGIASVGHRLTILKNVYDLKVNQDIPIEPDDYVPPSKPFVRVALPHG
jgi:protein STE50